MPNAPTPPLVASFVGLTIMVVLGGFVAAWAYTLLQLWRRQPLIPWQPRRHVPWGLIDLAIIIGLFFVAILVSREVLGFLLQGKIDPAQLTLADNRLIVIADGAAKLAIMGVAIPAIILRTGVGWHDWGIYWREAARDVVIGVVAFCMLAPIVYAIQALMVQFQPYEHPLMKMMEKTPDLTLFWILVFSASIMAPLSEEWFFRVVLQGWLEKVFSNRGSTSDLVLGDASVPAIAGSTETAVLAGDLIPRGLSSPGEFAATYPNPYQPPAALVGEDMAYAWPLPQAKEAIEYRWPQSLLRHFLPIVMSALIFALMHLSHGLAWIPLTFLALGLGYIYQRTHSILPGIVVHFLFNSLSMAVFWVQLFEADKLPGK